MHVDGPRIRISATASVAMKNLEGAVFEHYLRLNFSATNNEAEYEAFIIGLKSSKKWQIPELISLVTQNW